MTSYFVKYHKPSKQEKPLYFRFVISRSGVRIPHPAPSAAGAIRPAISSRHLVTSFYEAALGRLDVPGVAVRPVLLARRRATRSKEACAIETRVRILPEAVCSRAGSVATFVVVVAVNLI